MRGLMWVILQGTSPDVQDSNVHAWVFAALGKSCVVMGHRVPPPLQLWAGQVAPESSPASCHWHRSRIGGVTGGSGRRAGVSSLPGCNPTQAPPQKLLPSPTEQLEMRFFIPSLADSCELSHLVAGTWAPGEVFSGNLLGGHRQRNPTCWDPWPGLDWLGVLRSS